MQITSATNESTNICSSTLNHTIISKVVPNAHERTADSTQDSHTDSNAEKPIQLTCINGTRQVWIFNITNSIGSGKLPIFKQKQSKFT